MSRRFSCRQLHELELQKGKETYVVRFDDDSKPDALRKLGLWASNPELSFTWYDCAWLSKQLRDLSNEQD